MLRVRLQIPDLQPADRYSSVHVEVRDTSIADALHPTVADAWAELGLDSDEREIAIDVPAGSMVPGHRYSVWAHVGHGSTGELRRGDLITTVDIPIMADAVAAGAVIDVPLTRI